MKVESGPNSVGRQLGCQGIDHIVELAGNYVDCERRRIEAAHRADIVECKARLCFLQERKNHLEEQRELAPPPGDLRTRRRRCIYYASIAVLLTIAGYFFALLAFDPFRFGWKSHLYCLAIAVVTPFTVDKLLDLWKSEWLLRALAAIAVTAALVSLALLAVVRGEILAQQLQAMDPVVVSGLEQTAPEQAPTDFYAQTLNWLRLTMALLAIALEIGAGLALHDAWRYGSNLDDDWGQIAKELGGVQREMAALVRAIAEYESLPEQFVSGFWADFFRAMLEGTVKHAITKGIATLILLFLATSVAAAQSPVSLVVAIDLSRSLQVKSPNGKSEHQLNVEAIGRLLSTTPAGSRVSIIAITDRSLTQPFVLLSCQVSSDAGYFNERLKSARKRLVRAWAQTSKSLQPDFAHTDVFGALVLAGQIFDDSPGMKKVLVILSDMRHEAFGVNLESPGMIDGAEMIKRVERSGLIAELEDAEVHITGAVAPGKLPAYWQSLRRFWRQYFDKAGAALSTFAVTRDLPRL